MQSYTANRKDLFKWLESLSKSHNVFGPVRGADHLVRFKKISNPQSIEWDYTGSIIPPKKYFLPAEEILFSFKNNSVAEQNKPTNAKENIIAGLHPCDLHSFRMMDMAMGDGVKDSGYFSKREKSILIGMSCIPDEFCFCNCMGSSEAPEKGLDIFLILTGDMVLIDVKSERGASLLKGFSEKKESAEKEESARKEYRQKRESAFSKRSYSGTNGELKNLFLSRLRHPHWQELAKRCLSCSACTAVCPTCFCFDVYDETNLDGSEGTRIRRWDSCQLECFTKVAGGEVFRKERSERVKHRFSRKFIYLKKRYDATFCVGCGRCGRACPVKISIPEVIQELSKAAAS